MSIITNTLGPNSFGLVHTPATDWSEMADAIEAIITTKGWQVFDAQAGNFARCYRAPMADKADVYKYLVLDWNSASYSYIYTRVYESWNATNHTGTNLCYGSDNSNIVNPSRSSGGTLYLFVTPRYLLLSARSTNGSQSNFAGVCEITKDNEKEVTGTYPRFAFVNGNSMIGSSGSSSYSNCFSLPRNIGNQTGQSACYYNTVSTICGMTYGVTAKLSAQLPGTTNPFETDSPTVYTFTPYAVDNHSTWFNIRGRFYGLKALAKNTGGSMDLISIKINSEGFYSSTGTATDHHIIPANTTDRFAIPV